MGHRQKGKNKKRRRSWHHQANQGRHWQQALKSWPVTGIDLTTIDYGGAITLIRGIRYQGEAV